MKILLINPSLRPNNPRKLFPIGLASIATALHNAGYDFQIYDIDAHRYSDEEVEKFFRDNRFDVVAFGCLVSSYRMFKRLVSIVKSPYPGTIIIAGNSVASSIPELLLNKTEVDIAVIGEGDVTIVELIKAIENSEPLSGVNGIYYKENGKIFSTPKREVIKNIDDIPFINRDLFDIDEYVKASKYNTHEAFPIDIEKIRAFNINTARGCVFKCSFCYHVFINDKYRFRSPRSIIAEIKELKEKYGANYIQFWDDLSFYSKDQIERFCDELDKERLEIFWTGTIMPGVLKKENLNLAKKMRQLGCVGLGYSIESTDPAILKMMRKPTDLDKFIETRHVLRQAKIVTFTSLVFGYPIETEETIKNTIDFCIKEEVMPSGGYLLALPGTWIYKYALEKGLIKDEEEYLLSIGDRQDLHLNFTSMSNEKLVSLVEEGVRKYHAALGVKLGGSNPLKTLSHKSKDSLKLEGQSKK